MPERCGSPLYLPMTLDNIPDADHGQFKYAGVRHYRTANSAIKSPLDDFEAFTKDHVRINIIDMMNIAYAARIKAESYQLTSAK
jgi:hypothetical protein